MKVNIKKKTAIIVIVISIFVMSLIVGAMAYFKNPVVESIDEDNIVEEIEEIPEKKVQIIDLDDNTRPFAVMINNNSAVWKYQSGLNEAYIVYELLVEGGITREMAVFKNYDISKIQSVRSSRHYFLDYALENDAIYVHWGYSPQAQSDIKTLGINNINGLTYEGKYFFRDKTVKAAYEHKGYTTGDYLKTAVSNLKYRSTTDSSPLLTYSVTPIDFSLYENAVDTKYVALKFASGYTVKFIYDTESLMYKKTQNNTEMYDYTTNERMTTKNIIVYKNSYSGIAGDNKGRQNLSNIGSGEGYFISEGKSIPITWEKTSRSSKTKYKLVDGSELVVNDGETYIEIIPNSGTITLSEEIPA